MSQSESLNITVLIAGRPFSLSVKAREEHLIRKAVKEINDKVNEFQSTYKNRDKQDCLSMALLTYAVDLSKLRIAYAQQGAAEKVDELNELLDHALKHID